MNFAIFICCAAICVMLFALLFELFPRKLKWDRVINSQKDGGPLLYIKILWKGWGRRVCLHKIIYPDPWGQFHSHPANAIRIILRNGYVEELLDGTMREWKPGMIGLVRPDDVHRINRVRQERPSYSLWLRGKVTHEIYLKGDGWPVEWRDRPAAGPSDTEIDYGS